MSQNIYERVRCPCCGYPTLDERAAYDICILCNWEDDGQDNPHADVVMGGPNADYSLTEARNSFKSNLIMYSKDRDVRITKGQTKEEIELKKALMKVFAELATVKKNTPRNEFLQTEVRRIEGVLHNITHEKIKKYEDNINKNVEAIDAINSGVIKEIVDGLLSLALYADDWKFIQDIIVKYARHDDDNVRGIAILCFGHVARLHRKLDLDIVLPIVKKAKNDNSSFVRGHAESALDDIKTFMTESNI